MATGKVTEMEEEQERFLSSGAALLEELGLNNMKYQLAYPDGNADITELLEER